MQATATSRADTAPPPPRCPGRFVRVCQDLLKSRPKCEKATREALAAGRSAVIDRTNLDTKQREAWVAIAAAARSRTRIIV